MESTHIARIHIDSRQPVTFEFEGTSHVCGHVFRARVLESLKGGTGQLLFFGYPQSGFVDLDRDYVVMLFDRKVDDEALRKRVLSELGPREYKNVSCQLAASRWFVRSTPPTLVPFEPSTYDQEGSIARLRLGVFSAALLPNEMRGETVKWSTVKRGVLRILGQ